MDLYYISSVDSGHTARETFALTGYNPEKEGSTFLSEVGIYTVIPDDPGTFNTNLYEATFSYVVSGIEATQTTTLAAVALADAKTYAKSLLKSSYSSKVENIFSSSGYSTLALIAASSKLAADRGSDIQSVISNLQAEMTELDSLITDVDNAVDVPEIQEIVESLSTSEATVFIVTVSGGDFYVDNVQQGTVSLERGVTYRFNQNDSTNAGHPLKIYTDATKTTEITEGVTFVGTPGSVGSYTEFIPTTSGTFSYQCGSHAGMGGDIIIS